VKEIILDRITNYVRSVTFSTQSTGALRSLRNRNPTSPTLSTKSEVRHFSQSSTNWSRPRCCSRCQSGHRSSGRLP